MDEIKMISDAIPPYCQNYYARFPRNTLPSICRSALFSFTATLLAVNPLGQLTNFRQPLQAAGVAAFAAFIHALTTPLFNDLFRNEEVRWYQEVIRLAVDLGATHYVLKTATMSKIDLFSRHFFDKERLWLLSTNLFKLTADLSVFTLHWTLGWIDEEKPRRLKYWLENKGLDFKTRSNAVYLVL